MISSLLRNILQLYIYVIILDALLSWVPDVRRQKWAQMLHRAADVAQKPIREFLPQGLPIDPSPIILIILIQMLMYIL